MLTFFGLFLKSFELLEFIDARKKFEIFVNKDQFQQNKNL